METQIPETINSIVADSGSADTFNTRGVEIPVKIDSISEAIRHNVSITDYAAVEEGRVYYKKDIQSERAILKNFLSLYGDTLTKAVLTSNIADDYKTTVQKSIKENINSIHCSIDAIGSLTDALNKQKNILDVKRISFIMLGYATAIIKKIYYN
jgi:hypothetical protein